MSQTAPALAPLFRSEQQMRILAVLYTGADEELPIGRLAEIAEVTQSTASREVARLAEHNIVVTRTLGRNRLVRPNWDLPWSRELRAILTQTIGVLGRLSEGLAQISGVDEAYVFGSWAARYTGEPGPAPRDIDVIVIGDATLRQVRQACRSVQDDLRVDINPVVVTARDWDDPDPEPFIAELKSRPLVPIPLEIS